MNAHSIRGMANGTWFPACCEISIQQHNSTGKRMKAAKADAQLLAVAQWQYWPVKQARPRRLRDNAVMENESGPSSAWRSGRDDGNLCVQPVIPSQRPMVQDLLGHRAGWQDCTKCVCSCRGMVEVSFIQQTGSSPWTSGDRNMQRPSQWGGGHGAMGPRLYNR